MNNRIFHTLLLLMLCLVAKAQQQPSAASTSELRVTTFRHTGPVPVKRPVMIDTLDLFRKAYDASSSLELPVDLSRAKDGSIYTDTIAPSAAGTDALHLLQFTATSLGYAKATIKADSLTHCQIYIDGTLHTGETTFTPGSHEVIIKYLSQPQKREKLRVSLTSSNIQLFSLSQGAPDRLTLARVMDGRGYSSVALSHSGRYLLTCFCDKKGAEYISWRWRITDLKTRRTIIDTDKHLTWQPGTDAYITISDAADGKQAQATDLATGAATTLCRALDADTRCEAISPRGNYAILSKAVDGPSDDADVHQYVAPDDRQPGWRRRTIYYLLDLATGATQQLTFGYRNVSLADISADGSRLLFFVSRQRLTERPTTLNTLLMLDLETMQTKTLVSDDGFIAEASFSPDARTVAVKGSPEAFGGIGKDVPEGRVPSMFDYQLYTIDVASLSVTPLTLHFNPSIEKFAWSQYDKHIYFTALDRDAQPLFRADAKTGRIERLSTPEECITDFSLSATSPLLAYSGQSADNRDRVYTADTRSLKPQLIDDASALSLSGITLTPCRPWHFVNAGGDTICGRYYLPPHFDPSKRYPLIVYYYGGCLPTSRFFGSSYCFHLYASMGYVVYVLQPSGSAGFGQEFASRHVNTAGEGPAQDIIEGTKRFCQEHSFVNPKKVGCLGASYGGFMTQYLQTKTDIFAAAISHAGISDHTSYWGEGYWGYSYSETSMAGSYPWTRKDLYVDRSPLYNADKIHTPLLFLHGTADTNVPIGESIQMYTALRLLGRPTAFVVVEGQDHHISDYAKQAKWQSTIFAWFAKWLQDDDTWWKSMYDKMPE